MNGFSIIALILLAVSLRMWWNERRENARLKEELQLYSDLLGQFYAAVDTVDDSDENT